MGARPSYTPQIAGSIQLHRMGSQLSYIPTSFHFSVVRGVPHMGARPSYTPQIMGGIQLNRLGSQLSYAPTYYSFGMQTVRQPT